MGALDKLLQYWCAACWHVEAARCPIQAYVGSFLGRFWEDKHCHMAL